MYIQSLFKRKKFQWIIIKLNYNELTLDTIRAVWEHGVKNG